jgi:hypothetical protein
MSLKGTGSCGRLRDRIIELREEHWHVQGIWRDGHHHTGGECRAHDYPSVVVARDARDAEAVAEKAAGPNALAETLRELTDDEAREHALDLHAHGTAKVLPILNL